jgi:hypothetical protein
MRKNWAIGFVLAAAAITSHAEVGIGASLKASVPYQKFAFFRACVSR